jgi:hypothetical protein
MTAEEWLTATEPMQMLDFIEPIISERKARLVACACCRRIWHLFILRKHEPSRKAVELVEAVADGKVSDLRLPSAWEEARTANGPFIVHHTHAAALTTCRMPDNLRELISHAASATGNVVSAKIGQCGILRDIFGNPFRAVAAGASWLTSTVVALADGIYQERAFDRLPILADALQDADCDNEEILNHCRQPGEHVRGCWVVDLLLGKA